MTSTIHEPLTAAPPPTTEEVSPGIFAYIQLDGSWGLNNPGFIVGRRAVTVVDSCLTLRRARALQDAVRSKADLPVSTLINTHNHGDHTYGNCAFGPEVTIVGHAKCRDEILAMGLPQPDRFPGVDYGDVTVAPPFLTFDQRITLHVDDLRLELIYVGPAHTTNDVVVWIPERKVLLTGDIIFHQGTPFAMGGSVAGWLHTLEDLRTLGAETIIPGHGPVCGPDVFNDVTAYLRFIQELARDGFEADEPPLAVARDAGLGRFASWPDRERIVGNLHRAYAELRGEPLGAPIDAVTAFKEMIEYNGGQPLRCLA